MCVCGVVWRGVRRGMDGCDVLWCICSGSVCGGPPRGVVWCDGSWYVGVVVVHGVQYNSLEGGGRNMQ